LSKFSKIDAQEIFDTDYVNEFLSKHRCRRCGNCCKWPGHTIIYGSEIHQISSALGITESEFARKYLKIVEIKCGDEIGFRFSLMKKSNGICIFYHNGCSIQATKPLVCRVGAAGWHWVTVKENFNYYITHSKSFDNPQSNDTLLTNKEAFYASWKAEYDEPHYESPDSLLQECDFSSSLKEQLIFNTLKGA